MEREKLIATVTAAQNGDSDALNELFNAFYNDVYYFALKTVKDDDLACDITQETFVEIINTIGDLHEPAAFVKWMKQITYHQCTRYFKKKKDVLVDEDEEGNSVFDTLAEDKTEFIPDEALDQQDFRDTILTMLDELSEEQRSATMLYYYDELSVKQIAEIQNVSEGTVKSRLNYARKSIRNSVETYEKKNGVKLHCAGVLPLLLWLLSQTGKETMPAAAVKTVAGGVTAATGITVSAAASAGGAAVATATATTVATATNAGIAAKIVALPVVAKVVAGVVAGSLVLGGVGLSVLPENDPVPTDPITTTVPSNTQETIVDQTEQTNQTESTQVTEEIPCVPEGCIYVLANGTRIEAGEAMPKSSSDGDSYITPDYTYLMQRGWIVIVNDKTKKSYEPLLTEICGVSLRRVDFSDCKSLQVAPDIPEGVTDLSGSFWGCVSLTTVPSLPDTVTNMSSAFQLCGELVDIPAFPENLKDLSFTFSHCTSLVTIPEIPKSVTEMEYAFRNCTSLVSVPTLPDGIQNMECMFVGCVSLIEVPNIPAQVTNMEMTFDGCKALTDIPDIPAGVTNMTYTFYGCTSLAEAPAIPAGVTSLDSTFRNCASLVKAPAIPDGVTEMLCTFAGCTSLVDAPLIPSSVTNMVSTFSGCSALVNAPDIPDCVTNMSGTFQECRALISAPVIPASVTDMMQTFYFCDKLTGTVEIHANPTSYERCFEITQMPITLTGSSTMLAELAATGTNGNVTVQLAE